MENLSEDLRNLGTIATVSGSSESLGLKTYTKAPLALPRYGDTLEELESKMRDLSDCVIEGYSLASATRFKDPDEIVIQDPERRAESRMKVERKGLYRIWKRGLTHLPPYDPKKNSLPTVVGSNGQVKRERRAEALDRLYGTRGSTVENVTWWISTYPTLIPLINAMSRVIGAERESVPVGRSMTVPEAAEAKVIDLIWATCQHVLNQHMSKVRAMVRRINDSSETIQSRKEYLGRP
ncbi:hypothetical protein BJ684DRAFT_12802 [Piptocephalis cylindrospora]|uniref:Uncharacterized protein n=1 Tax=Piptocephalis cylindrospora TaxID=1907219 RepID=A0A4P9XZG6_9FUNG|nr:hypothetical protein BJ684DRAFT_12802 [Piptocephalis cylindrospora]|eukprot:RKP11532.1 hypothetical protein BJ684DRAFT_12802 [Piptocephalis cylindrospora]